MSKKTGSGSLLLLAGVIMAIAIMAVPLVKWQMQSTYNVASLTAKLQEEKKKKEMIDMVEILWKQINGMNFDEIKSASDKTTSYENYDVLQKFAPIGKYNKVTGACDFGTPTDNERECRIVELTITDKAGTMQIGPLTSTKVSPSIIVKPEPKSDEGYVEFDNGLIIQSGVVKNVSLCELWYDVHFPHPFKQKVMGVTVTLAPEAGPGIVNYHPKTHISYGFVNGDITPTVLGTSITKNGMRIGADLYGGYLGDPPFVTGNIYWMAIGM